MHKDHHYSTSVIWTGNSGQGTKSYASYDRSYTIGVSGKKDIEGSSDPAFRGDSSKYNPEELLLASISSCHMLWYLHLCAVNSIVVTHYKDQASATMVEFPDGGGKFTEVTLYPVVTISASSPVELAHALHKEANAKCFIASSLNVEVKHQAVILTETI